jgi:hypothetical protein
LIMTANAPQLWAQSGSSVNEEDSAWREVLRFQDDATSLLQKDVISHFQLIDRRGDSMRFNG